MLALPPSLQDAFARVTPPSQAERSAFGFWFTRDVSPDATSASVSIPEIDGALTQYASTHGVAANRSAASNLWTLKDSRAGLCLARLQRVVATPIEGTHLLRVLATAAARATGAKAAGGFVGSCIGTNQFAQQSVHTEGGHTLETTLNEMVGAFGASVWVAIQNGADVCSLGVIQRAQGGGVCSVTLADNLASPAK